MNQPSEHDPPRPTAAPEGELVTWSTWREARAVLARPAILRRTTAIALVVGTVLFAINQLDIVLRGDADTVVWAKSAITYIVPFCVSCAGVLTGTRRPPTPPRRRQPPTSAGSSEAS